LRTSGGNRKRRRLAGTLTDTSSFFRMHHGVQFGHEALEIGLRPGGMFSKSMLMPAKRLRFDIGDQLLDGARPRRRLASMRPSLAPSHSWPFQLLTSGTIDTSGRRARM
jgi:hypothetical protein